MRKRIILTLFMIVCLVLGGCGSSGDSRELVADEDYGDTADYEDDASSDMEDTASEDYEEESEVSTVEDSADDTDTSPAEAEGIVAMVLYRQDWKRGAQIICIDPATGEQNIVADFIPNYSVGVDDYSIQPPLKKIYGNDCNWISEDFTKMAATKTFTGTNESHAGWIDLNGNFFDVTEAVSASKEQGFTDTGVSHQESVGFIDGAFIFCESGIAPYYAISLDNVSENTFKESDEDFSFYCKGGKEAYPTDWVDEKNAITDIYGVYPGGGMYYDSVIVNSDNGGQTSYIPESNRYNWSGVLSPDGNTIAFLSVPNDGGNLGLYSMPITGGEPTNITLIQNEETVIDIASLTKSDIYEHYGLERESSTDFCCYLIGWK